MRLNHQYQSNSKTGAQGTPCQETPRGRSRSRSWARFFSLLVNLSLSLSLSLGGSLSHGGRTLVVIRQRLTHAHQDNIAQPLPLQRQLVVEPLHLIACLRV